MKFSKVLLASTLLIFGLTACTKGGNDIIVKVNDKPVTQAQYNEAYKEEVQIAQNGQFEEFLKDPNSIMSLMLKDRLVNELILKALVEQEIEKRNIQVTKEEVEARRAEIIEKIGSKEKVKELLKANGVSSKRFEEDIAKELKVEKLILSTGNANVSDKEVLAFYNQNKAKFNYPERVRASHILIEVNPAAIKQEIISQDKKGTLTSEEINKKTQDIIDSKMNLAKEVRAKAAQNPENFAALAKQYSDDKTSAERGGDLGMFDRKTMVKPFSDAAFRLKPGTVSEVVVTDFGNHIILVTDKAAAGMQPYEKVKDEIAVYLLQKKKLEALNKLVAGLKATAKIDYVSPSYDLRNIEKLIKTQQQHQEEIRKQELKNKKRVR